MISLDIADNLSFMQMSGMDFSSKSLGLGMRHLSRGELRRRCFEYEDDISAEEKAEKQGAWFQSQNEHTGRKKGFSCEAC